MTFLGGHPEWRRKAAEEVRTLLSENSSGTCLPSVSENLATVPLEAWENNTPVMDKIIRETLRVAQPHTAMRRNMGPETYLNGTRIPSGAYVVYPFSDVHLNEDLYPNPWAFDPDRPDPNLPFGYVGWGGGKPELALNWVVPGAVLTSLRVSVGKTVCLGQRLAKLQLKMIMALMLLDLELDLIDKMGCTPNPLPRPNWNDALTCKPPSGSCYLHFRRTYLH